MSRTTYSTDLTDAEWTLLEPLVPGAKPGGRPAKYPRREVINAIRYVLRTGCAWRLLPHDLPRWQLVYHYFWVWRREGNLAADSRCPPTSGSKRWRSLPHTQCGDH
jgi:putative transposase